MKNKVVCLLFLLTTTFAFGNKNFTTDGEVVSSDISGDSYIWVGNSPYWSGSHPHVDLVVDNNVTFSGFQYLYLYETNSITFKGGNTVSGGQFSSSANSFLYATNTVFNLKTFDMGGADNAKAEIIGGKFNVDRLNVADSASITFDGTSGKIGSMAKRGSVNGGEESGFNMTLKNGSSMEVSPAYLGALCANVYLESGSSLTIGTKLNTGTEIVVGAGCSMTVNGTLTTSKTLTVAADATVSASGFDFDKLTIVLDEDFSQGDTGSIDLATIFGSSSSLVMSALESQSDSKLTIKDSSGKEFNLASENISGSTISFEVGSQVVPEPATYATIFGALALAFVAYRRRR